ncbi:MAG TPA: hypothetical protein VI029_02380 [Mycobacterium sp.]
MRSSTSRRAFALTAAGACVAGTLMFPAVASAAGPDVHAAPATTGITVDGAGWRQDRPGHADWNHPEWGRGWNNGYPAPGWIPPAGWAPPPDWAPPRGWFPPRGYAPPPNWVGPCAGPLFDLFHPLRCA